MADNLIQVYAKEIRINIRDTFAMHALATISGNYQDPDKVAQYVYDIADAMLKIKNSA